MGWLWRADADGGADGEETPRRRELPDDTASDMEHRRAQQCAGWQRLARFAQKRGKT